MDRETLMAATMIRLFKYAEGEAEAIGAVCHPPAFSKTVGIAHLLREGERRGWVIEESPPALAREAKISPSPDQTYRHLYKSLENMGIATLDREEEKIRGIDLHPLLKYAEEVQKEWGGYRLKWLGQAIHSHLCISFEMEKEKEKGATQKNYMTKIGPAKIKIMLELAKMSSKSGKISLAKPTKKPISKIITELEEKTGYSRLTISQAVAPLEESGSIDKEESAPVGAKGIRLVWSARKRKELYECISKNI